MQELAEIKVYYPEDVAKLLGIKIPTYNLMCSRREIPAKKVGRRWVITETKLNEYLNKRWGGETMFRIWKENKKLKEQVKTKSLENTRLIHEIENYKYKLYKITALVDEFSYKSDNIFTLLNKIKKEAEQQE